MIFFDELTQYNSINNILKQEKLNLNNIQNLFNYQKQIILLYIEKTMTSLIAHKNNDDIYTTQNLSKLLSSFKQNLDKLQNIELQFKKIHKSLENLNYCNESDLTTYIQKYNKNYITLQLELSKYMTDTEKLIKESFNKFEFVFISSSLQSNTNINEQNEHNSIIDNFILKDNLNLVISEKDEKVILPYKLSELKKQLANSNKYSNLKELIQTEYILPLSHFNNPTLSRFKETYNLMKNKENASLLETVNLALELSLNSSLNPAVIAACKNKDELDIYLDCLYENELEDFKIFDVKYEMKPTLNNKKKNNNY